MKLSTMAKSSLALGILTTGLIATHAQSAHAESKNPTGQVQTAKQNEDAAFMKVKNYYKNGYTELYNVNAYKAPKRENVVVVRQNGRVNAIKLKGADKRHYNDKLIGVDVFVVNENNPKSKIVKTVGGITRTNNGPYYDYVANPKLKASKTIGGVKTEFDAFPYFINKEQVSLKELDFKIRKVLTDKFNLYENGLSKGKIRIIMNSGQPKDYYTFQLNRILEERRMGDVIDPKKIKEIQVEL